MIQNSEGAQNSKAESIINKALIARRAMWTKHAAEALEFTMRWKDRCPLPGKQLSVDTDTAVSIELIKKDSRQRLM